MLATLLRGLPSNDYARGHAQGTEDPAHEFTLVAGQVIVDRDDVNATANNCVEVSGECRNESLAFTRAHFGDVAKVKCGTTHELNVKVTQANGAAGSFSNRRERFGEHVVE